MRLWPSPRSFSGIWHLTAALRRFTSDSASDLTSWPMRGDQMRAAFVAVTRIFNLVVAGVQPEAWVLTAMMTAPFTVGVVLLATVGMAVDETIARLKRRAVGA